MSDRGQERNVKVGILKAQEIRVVFHSAYLLDGKPLVGEHCFTPTAEERLFVPAEKGASFTLKEVVIGIGFHWERKEDQTFCGALLLKMEEGQVRAINVVPVETYLTSVISSEMSANASLELLKAHAVISRSWLMRILNDNVDDNDNDNDKLSTVNCQLSTVNCQLITSFVGMTMRRMWGLMCVLTTIASVIRVSHVSRTHRWWTR